MRMVGDSLNIDWNVLDPIFIGFFPSQAMLYYILVCLFNQRRERLALPHGKSTDQVKLLGKLGNILNEKHQIIVAVLHLGN